MKIRCQCGAIYNVPESTGGKNVKCKKCANTFVCPTPPPKPNIGAATGAASAAPKQKVPGTFASNPYARSKSAQRTNQQEEEILKKFMSEEKSLEERMRDRREDSIEEDRTSNSMSYILVGVLWLAGAVVVGLALFGAAGSSGGYGFRRFRMIGWLLVGIGAQYWLPPMIGLVGLYKITIGVMSLFRVVDIESQEQLPEQW